MKGSRETRSKGITTGHLRPPGEGAGAAGWVTAEMHIRRLPNRLPSMLRRPVDFPACLLASLRSTRMIPWRRCWRCRRWGSRRSRVCRYLCRLRLPAKVNSNNRASCLPRARSVVRSTKPRVSVTWGRPVHISMGRILWLFRRKMMVRILHSPAFCIFRFRQ